MQSRIGTFAYLPDLTDEQIREQVRYCGLKGWACVVEYTHDPSPRNSYWERWGIPLLDPADPDMVLFEVAECRKARPRHYIRVTAYESLHGRANIRHTFLVHRPPDQDQA
jgi:ribulose-bisphosphate carboxylase small chain